MDNKKIGIFISNHRKDLGLTQQQLADRIGVSNKTISKWETGEGYPDITVVLDLARALYVTADELLTGENHFNDNGYICQPDHQESVDNRPVIAARVSRGWQHKAKLLLTSTLAAIGISMLCGFLLFSVSVSQTDSSKDENVSITIEDAQGSLLEITAIEASSTEETSANESIRN